MPKRQQEVNPYFHTHSHVLQDHILLQWYAIATPNFFSTQNVWLISNGSQYSRNTTINLALQFLVVMVYALPFIASFLGHAGVVKAAWWPDNHLSANLLNVMQLKNRTKELLSHMNKSVILLSYLCKFRETQVSSPNYTFKEWDGLVLQILHYILSD